MKLLIVILLLLSVFQLISGRFVPSKMSSLSIYGGVDAADGQAPYQCSLQSRTETSNSTHTLGCTILSSRWVLTVGVFTFVVNETNDGGEGYKIYVGSTDLDGNGSYYYFKQFFLHSSYDEPNYANDIALIRTENKIIFNQYVQPIKYSKIQIPENSRVQMTGWGRLSNGSMQTHLQIVNLTTMSIEECRESYKDYGVQVPECDLCTYSNYGKRTSPGDSGSPLVYEDTLVGINSYRIHILDDSNNPLYFPDLFTNVSYYYDWIEEIRNSFND